MIVNCNAQHLFGSGSVRHYSRIITADGEEYTLTAAEAAGLIHRGEKTRNSASNDFWEMIDQEVFALRAGLKVREVHHASPGSRGHDLINDLPLAPWRVMRE